MPQYSLWICFDSSISMYWHANYVGAEKTISYTYQRLLLKRVNLWNTALQSIKHIASTRIHLKKVHILVHALNPHVISNISMPLLSVFSGYFPISEFTWPGHWLICRIEDDFQGCVSRVQWSLNFFNTFFCGCMLFRAFGNFLKFFWLQW